MTSTARDRIRHELSVRKPLDIPDVRPEGSRIDTAVLVPLSASPAPTLTMLVRADGLRHHAREVGFPGGKPEDRDGDLVSTATREAREELGLSPELVDVLGRLTPVPVATSRYRIHPFVGWIDRLPRWTPSGEVGRVLDIPLASLADGDIAYHAVHMQWAGRDIQSPFFIIDDQTRLYGASAFVLVELMSVVGPELGLELPAPRLVDSP